MVGPGEGRPMAPFAVSGPGVATPAVPSCSGWPGLCWPVPAGSKPAACPGGAAGLPLACARLLRPPGETR